jgi:hypothetical protein
MQETWEPVLVSPEFFEVEPTVEGLRRYLSDLGDLERVLTQNKAMVFRGFGVRAADLDQLLSVLLPGRLPYVNGTSPRTKVGQNVYTSTEYPSGLTITMHNELSYSNSWPRRLAFYCDCPPTTQGATPVVDAELWLQLLDDDIREAFAGGVRYIQNLHGGYGFGISWQQAFETDDRAAAETILTAAEVQWEWRGQGGLHIEQVRPATACHPITGAEVWFNQADQFHPAGLGDEAASELAEVLEPDELPQSAVFADGSEIPAEYIRQIQKKGLSAAVDVDWNAGDLLVIDNILVAHGRRPYTGPRRVLVAMS